MGLRERAAEPAPAGTAVPDAVPALLTLLRGSGGGDIDIGHTGSTVELISDFLSDGM